MTSGPSRSADDTLERVLGFLRTGLVRTADAARRIDGGLVLSTPTLPAVWSVNQLRVSDALPFEALVALADEQLAGFDYRHVVLEREPAGAHLEDAFRAAGWELERDLLMILTAAADRVLDASAVSDAGQDEVLELMARWHGEGWATGTTEVGQLLDYSRREAKVHDDRLLGVRSSDGQLVAIAKLRGEGGIAQVEDVYTVPEARGRGHARALVGCAAELAREAGHQLIFIVADDRDWPKLLYSRLGFRPLGRVWQFHRG